MLSGLTNNSTPFGLPLFGTPAVAYDPIYIPVRFDIDEDFDMLMQDSNTNEVGIHIASGGEIQIENFAEVDIQQTLVTSCDDKWQSITLKPGSTLEMSDCIIENGINAIVLESASILRLDNVTFRNCDVAIISNGGNIIDVQNCRFENCTNGIIINGDPNSTTISNNTFDGSTGRCITIRDNTSSIPIGPENTFDNSNNGIGVFNGSADIKVNTFLNVNNSIKLGSGNFSKITENQIGFNDIGIEVIGANFEAIDNRIGLPDYTGHHAVDIIFSDDYTLDNNDIDAIETGVDTRFCKEEGLVHMNRIGLVNPPAMGVDRFFGSDRVMDNEITARYTPVRSNSTYGEALVHNNKMISTKEGPIYIGGSMGNYLTENDIDTGNNGVFFLNAGGNTMECNDIIAGGDAIEVNANSDNQIIKGNILSASDQAVLTFSTLGEQRFHGNYFPTKSITAVGFSDVNNSRFVIDEDAEIEPGEPGYSQDEENRDPQIAIPAEFRKLEPRNKTYPECVGEIGSDLEARFKDPKFACNYLKNIESYEKSNPKYYWTQMYHMLRFYLFTIPLNNWPDCIISKWNDALPCGMKTLLTKETELKKSLSSKEERNTGSDNAEGNEEATKSIKEIATEQLEELSEIRCTEELIFLWLDAYRFILKKIKGDPLTQSEKKRLTEIAQQCSPEYGDAVHWARALASEYDDVDYTQYDENCHTETDSRSRESTVYNIKDISLTPNPASHLITIKSNFSEEHNLLLIGVDGRVLDKIDFSGHSFDYDISQYKSGIYFIKDVDTSELVKFIKI